MKIVINKCHGGFGLSPHAIARLAELRGQKAYFFSLGIGGKQRTMFASPDDVEGMFWTAFNTPTPTTDPSGQDWAGMSLKQKTAANKRHAAEVIDTCSDEDKRSDPLLIKVVEELGNKASGRFSQLAVVEIPDGVEWSIEEYDGMEWIAEKHRTWA